MLYCKLTGCYLKSFSVFCVVFFLDRGLIKAADNKTDQFYSILPTMKKNIMLSWFHFFPETHYYGNKYLCRHSGETKTKQYSCTQIQHYQETKNKFSVEIEDSTQTNFLQKPCLQAPQVQKNHLINTVFIQFECLYYALTHRTLNWYSAIPEFFTKSNDSNNRTKLTLHYVSSQLWQLCNENAK